MKRFLTKIFIWFLLFFSLGIGFMQIPSIQFYGNPEMDSKIIYFSKNYKNYNSVIIGSSRMYRQVDPNVIKAESQNKLSAFNLGIPDGNFFEQMDIINTIPKENLKYVIWEIIPITDFDKINIDTERSYFVRDLKNTRLLVSAINENTGGIPLKPWLYYMKNVFHYKKLRFKHRYKEYRNDGFRAIDADENLPWIKARNLSYLKDTLVIEKRIRKNEKVIPKIHFTLTDEILKLNTELKKQNIQLILLVPPINKNNIDLHKFVSSHIKIIDLYSPKQYPEFYLSKNIWDIGHLNARGAEIFSEILAKQLNEINQP